MNRKISKISSKIIASAIIVSQVFTFNTLVFADEDYDYSNPIYSEGTDDTFMYDSNDSVITTKTGIKRNIPKVTGLYDISKYPIPLKNRVPDKDTFELIKSENKKIMDRVEEDIKNGTLTKHKSADGQFYGSVSDSALGVEKKIYINTNAKGAHSLASYVPAGEIASIKLNDEALKYAKKGKIKISVGMTMIDAEDYTFNNNDENRMPYLGKVFSINEKETKVGTPFGGMVYLEVDDSVPSGLNLEVDVKGVVDTPYYDLGKTTSEEWKKSKDAPGLFAEIRTPYLRFLVPAKFIRHVEDPYKAALFWTNVVSLSSDTMNQQNRNKPMSLIFDQYISAGVAYASIGLWTCNLPPSWAETAFNYDELMKNGNWGLIHEINHHYQGRYSGYSDQWGIGDEFSEITNNALSTVSYILYTNIAAYRNEEGTQDWNKVSDPYSSLKQQLFEGDNYYPGKPNIGNFMYSTFAHEIGPKNFLNVIKSTYDGGTFNGEYIPAYDYRLESDQKKPREDRYDDLAYRLCVASERDYTWYIKNELLWPIKDETVRKIKSHGYKEVIPVQSVYGVGEVGHETGRPFYVPSSGYVFDFDKSLVSPGKVSILDISNPKYGTLTKRLDGKYDYKPSANMPENEVDEFILTVRVEADGISYETKINCKIGVDYNNSNVEKFNITKWDIHEALEDLKKAKPYATSSSFGMKIDADYGNNLARSKGYFVLDEGGEYQFQAFGDDRAVFELNLENGKTLQSLTEDYSDSAEDAYNKKGSTNFTVNLEANKPYSYTLITNNNDGPGWADVNIRKVGETNWKSIKNVYSNINDIGKNTDRSFTMPQPEYVRPHNLAIGNETLIGDIKVISNPKGVDPNNPDSASEADPNNMVDGDISTYFHSSYNNDKTPLPHEYIFDLGGEKSFNNIEVYTRRTGDVVGVIGDYEIYVADEYNGDTTKWTKIAEDYTRKGNQSASQDLKVSIPQTNAKYLKIKALNNRDNFDLTIIAELKLSTATNVNNVIAQNSSFIQYDGNWTKDSNGAFVNGATYNTTDGYFMYCFEGNESNIYVTKDVEVEMRVDGGKWQKRKLIGSLREPSITLDMKEQSNNQSPSKHVVEVRGVGQEISLNAISTDGTFYKGKAPAKSNPATIEGVKDIEIGVGEVDKFNPKSGIKVSDDYDTLTVDDIKISGTIEKPNAGENKVSELTYTIEDSDKNVTTEIRRITVTNQLPEIKGLDEVTIKKGTKIDLKENVSATDYEDKDISDKLSIVGIRKEKVSNIETDLLEEGKYEIEYSVTDSDNNTIAQTRILNVEYDKLDDEPSLDDDNNSEIDKDKDDKVEEDKNDTLESDKDSKLESSEDITQESSKGNNLEQNKDNKSNKDNNLKNDLKQEKNTESKSDRNDKLKSVESEIKGVEQVNDIQNKDIFKYMTVAVIALPTLIFISRFYFNN